MQELTNIIEGATSGISSSYFHLNIDGGNSIYRERVYCYELYHQMRLRWPDDTEFYLNGEIDKAAHPILRKLGADYAKPDLLIHKPGYMKGNHAIIEVKSARASTAGIRKDLRTLSLYVSKVGYQRAIYLIYGYETNAIVERILCVAEEFPESVPIELWLHRKTGEPAICHSTIPSSANRT